MWPLLHSPSGTRKRVIHRFVGGLNRFEDVHEREEDNYPIRRHTVNETTFENLGLVMENNDGRVIWYFDEARR